ncbi:DUF397 domain-containing protein [Nocardia jiangxiensis]|uniref:DUF397 domain-containing protein n=1 Tax=Nocardia jiangxiensis TaxID=282685 RepID=A0ABW6S494_9NOCA|nr:DUF397 domain-containing protein [Nocardia jiangxiensis]
MNDDLSTAKWFKSSHSETSANCVEVAWLGEGTVGVRDSKNPNGPALTFTPSEWDAFVAGTKTDDFNRP